MTTTRWFDIKTIETQEFECGYCGREVASDKGWSGEDQEVRGGMMLEHSLYVAVCPRCSAPTFVLPRHGQIPPPVSGEAVSELPEDVAVLYDEARRALSSGAPTGAVLLGRKLLMHVAVERGAEENQSFRHYVGYLADEGVVTEDMKDWVNEIREFGNDANHEIVNMTREDADELLTFLAMLLRVVYEYPAKGQRRMKARAERSE